MTSGAAATTVPQVSAVTLTTGTEMLMGPAITIDAARAAAADARGTAAILGPPGGLCLLARQGVAGLIGTLVLATHAAPALAGYRA